MEITTPTPYLRADELAQRAKSDTATTRALVTVLLFTKAGVLILGRSKRNHGYRRSSF